MRLMEVCGTHTAAIFKEGIRSLISSDTKLISGPGCPVCVTPTGYIDKCIEAAKEATLYSFGDMLKVPGSKGSLSEAKSQGACVELMYSPFQVLALAESQPDKEFVIAAVGFETTVPIYALLIDQAEKKSIKNLKLITSLKRAIPAIDWLGGDEDIDGFICPGHVSVIVGEEPYKELAEKYKKPFVIAGFEAEHILGAIKLCEENKGNPFMANLYTEAVNKNGNEKARQMIDKYFDQGAASWRGLGNIEESGYFLKDQFANYDMDSRYIVEDMELPAGCGCADVITGRIDPSECALFGESCTPTHPIGPCMVSSEGACGIWYQNR